MKAFIAAAILFALMGLNVVTALTCKFCQIPPPINDDPWSISDDKSTAVSTGASDSYVRTCQSFKGKVNKKFCIKVVKDTNDPNLPLQIAIGVGTASIIRQKLNVNSGYCGYFPGGAGCQSLFGTYLRFNRPEYSSGDMICVWVKKGTLMFTKNKVRIFTKAKLIIPPKVTFYGFAYSRLAGTRLQCVDDANF